MGKVSNAILTSAISLSVLSACGINHESTSFAELPQTDVKSSTSLVEPSADPAAKPEQNTAQEANSSKKAIPDLLTFFDGSPVEGIASWERRREEILEVFETQVYGKAGKTIKQWYTVDEVSDGFMDGKAIRKKVTVHYTGANGEGKLSFVLFLPKESSPAPAVIFGCNREIANIDPDRKIKSEFWPAEEIIDAGFATAAFHFNEIDLDFHDAFNNGVHGILDTERTDESWGTIAAWSWGFMRVMDYLETDGDINASKVAYVGHSRGGKAALWAGAQDTRAFLTVSSNSGCTGAAISRRKTGESIAEINIAFPHWFCQNYKNYNFKEDELPVDQHMLLASLAPRLLYVTSASDDATSDPYSEYDSCKEAEAVYDLYGKEALPSDEMPEYNSPVLGECIGYHVREGEHGLFLYDWMNFLQFYKSRL